MFAGASAGSGVDLRWKAEQLVDLGLLSAEEGRRGLDLDLGKVAAA